MSCAFPFCNQCGMWFVVVESLNVCCFPVSSYTVRVYCVRWLDATCTDFLTSHTGFVREVASMPSHGALTSCYSPREPPGRTVLAYHVHMLHMLASGGSQGLVVGLFKYALRRSVA